MELSLVLTLPRDESTVPLVRHLLWHTLREIGTASACIADISLAITEACANVVRHANDDDEYEVRVIVTDETCEIRVVDTGHGFDPRGLGLTDADAAAETGRGIQLMRSLVDNLQLQSEPEMGTVVRLSKALDFHTDHPTFVNVSDDALILPTST